VHDIHIRLATILDQSKISSHNAALARETEEKILHAQRGEKGVQTLLENREKGFYLLATRRDAAGNEKIWGQLLCLAEWSDWQNGVYWWLQSVYVIPGKRRQGIFRALFHALKELAEEEAEVLGLRLYVEKDNAVARKTYECLGFMESSYVIYETQAPK
jgi:ribosomal protein S18 acetylase RimI-like enzyme